MPVDTYKWLRYRFGNYILEYPEFKHLTHTDIDEIFDQMLTHMIHIANTYLDEEYETRRTDS